MGYDIPVVRLVLVRDSAQPAESPKASGPADVARILSDYLKGADREHFVALLVDAQNQVLGINTISVGTLTASLVHPREVFKAAIVGNAAGIILAHNHPSGNRQPSPEDLATMRRLVRAGAMLGIPVLDFMVVVEGWGYWSARENGALAGS